ncbi:MAG: hypothetical protein KF708_14595 [Pirellulales bacterium]|nr:hypothetical protein [Pirellulales bacterium]
MSALEPLIRENVSLPLTINQPDGTKVTTPFALPESDTDALFVIIAILVGQLADAGLTRLPNCLTPSDILHRYLHDRFGEHNVYFHIP